MYTYPTHLLSRPIREFRVWETAKIGRRSVLAAESHHILDLRESDAIDECRLEYLVDARDAMFSEELRCCEEDCAQKRYESQWLVSCAVSPAEKHTHTLPAAAGEEQTRAHVSLFYVLRRVSELTDSAQQRRQ